MNFSLSEEQELLQQMAREFVMRESSMQRIRRLRQDDLGFSREVWQKMADLGWQSILLPEALGGQNMGMVELAVVLEEIGRGLLPEPLISSVLLGGGALLEAGDAAQKKAWLEPMALGQKFLTLAYVEAQSRYDIFDIAVTATPRGNDWVLSGDKVFVADAASADAMVVSARIEGARRGREGLGLFVVETKSNGIEIMDQPCMDNRKRSTVRFKAADAQQLKSSTPADEVLERTIDKATVGLCAEMLGVMLQAFETTLDYMKTRKQFGQPIGAFQALKHRKADEYVQIELSRSAVYYAAMALDENMEDMQTAVSTAKSRCNEAIHLVANEALQMHGGIGMTDEHDIGLYFKRGRVAEATLGDITFHQDRYARLKEY